MSYDIGVKFCYNSKIVKDIKIYLMILIAIY